MEGIIISSVVPPVLNMLEGMAKKYFRIKPLNVGPDIETGMPIFYDNPAEVGADRIVNAVAAYERYKRSIIVVDFGTATTFDYVSSKGEYMGGAIAPGIGISSDALFLRTSKLPRVEIVKPKKVVGKNTNQQHPVRYLLRVCGAGRRDCQSHEERSAIQSQSDCDRRPGRSHRGRIENHRRSQSVSDP